MGSQGSGEVRKSVALTSPSPNSTHPSLLPGLVGKDLGVRNMGKGIVWFLFIFPAAPHFFFQPFPSPIMS